MLHPLMPNTPVDPAPVDFPAGSNAPHIDLAKALEPEALHAWLDYQFAAHQSRVNDLTRTFIRFDAATNKGINNDVIAGKTTDFIRQINEETKAIKKTHDRIKGPVKNAANLIDNYTHTWADPLAGQLAVAKSRLVAYHTAKERMERDARERAAREAEERAAALAAAADPEAEQAFEDAGAAMEAAIASAADVTRVHTARGGVSSLKVTWDFEVTDFEKIPRRFLLVAEALVKVAIREAPKNADGSPRIDIPGIRIVRVDGVTVR